MTDAPDTAENGIQKIMAALNDAQLLHSERKEFEENWNIKHTRNAEVLQSTQFTLYTIEYSPGIRAVFESKAERDDAFSRCVKLMVPLGAPRVGLFKTSEIGPFTISQKGVHFLLKLVELSKKRDVAVENMLGLEYRNFAGSCQGVINIEPCEVTFWLGKDKAHLRRMWTATHADAGALQKEINHVFHIADTFGEISIETRTLSSMKDAEVIAMFEHAFLPPKERAAVREPKINDFINEIWGWKK
jgi:hypothetical protein